MGHLNRKSEAGLTIIAIVIIAVLFLGWIINLNQRECRGNKDCGSEAYCGSDFSCHSFPTIQKNVVEYNFLIPSIIIGFAIVIASLIFRRNNLRMIEKTEEPASIAEEYKSNNNIEAPAEETKDLEQPYYTSNGNIKIP